MKHPNSRFAVRRAATGIAAASGAAVIALSFGAGPALAAGSPYGGPPVLPPGGVKGGFSSVDVAVTVPRKGKLINVNVNGARLTISVPGGAAPKGEQLVVTTGNPTPIKGSALRNVPKNVAREKAVYAMGILLQRDHTPVTDKALVTVTLTGKQFKKGDYVVVYSPKLHAFVPAPKFHARVVNGKVVVKFPAGTEFAVLAP
ncbi:MAG: hypothetical protein M0T71_08925 [Actinomycetota bacterium]|nr:hypothetical protein [Actinomycetota bacterium]